MNKSISRTTHMLRELFAGFQNSPILWQEEGSKELWLNMQINHAMLLADMNIIKDPLVAFDIYARALGLLMLEQQLWQNGVAEESDRLDNADE